MSQYRPTERARREREAAERRMKRMFWIGLTVPAIACTVAAVLIGPDSWLGWAAVIAVPPAAATGVAVAFMVQDRKKEPASCRHPDLSTVFRESEGDKAAAFTCTKCHELFSPEAAAQLIYNHSVETSRRWRADLAARSEGPT